MRDCENEFGTTCSISDGIAGLELTAVLMRRILDCEFEIETREQIERMIDLIDGQDARTVRMLLSMAHEQDMLMEGEEDTIIECCDLLTDSISDLRKRLEIS